MTIGERLRDASAALAEVSDTPRLDAELLLAYALGFSRAKLLGEIRSPLPPSVFDALMARRMNHEPIAYILGEWGFFSLQFEVRPPMLVPRPETELLVEAGLAFLATESADSRRKRVLDLCTGTGCVAIALAKNCDIDLFATDINPDAVALARKNAQRHAVDIEIFEGDLFEALQTGTAPFDLIVSNPPYVKDSDWETLSPVITKHEDPRALLSGVDGLDCVRKIVSEAHNWLRPGGMLALEIGEEQGQAATHLYTDAGFHDVNVAHDLAGHERIISGRV